MKLEIELDDDLYKFILSDKLLVMDLREVQEAIRHGTPIPENRETSKTNIDITDDEKVADWLARLRSDLEVFGFPRYRDTYQSTLDIAIKRFMDSAYPNSNVDVMAWKHEDIIFANGKKFIKTGGENGAFELKEINEE